MAASRHLQLSVFLRSEAGSDAVFAGSRSHVVYAVVAVARHAIDMGRAANRTGLSAALLRPLRSKMTVFANCDEIEYLRVGKG